MDGHAAVLTGDNHVQAVPERRWGKFAHARGKGFYGLALSIVLSFCLCLWPATSLKYIIRELSIKTARDMRLRMCVCDRNREQLN